MTDRLDVPDSIVPTKSEKKSIRKLYNQVGGALIAQYVLTYILMFIGKTIAMPYVVEAKTEDGRDIYGFAQVAVMFCAPAIASMITFFCYNEMKKIKHSSMFKTEGVTVPLLLKTVGACLIFHRVGVSVLQYAVAIVLDLLGLEMPLFDFELAEDAGTTFIDLFSSIILAPIAEEMLFRGVVLKEFSKVSQRFGIVMSALIFGLMHGNPYQFVMAAAVGVPLAYVTVKTGSLIPAIVGHMALNTAASIPGIVELFDSSLYDGAYSFVVQAEYAIGAVTMMILWSKGEIKMPPYTDYHKKRTLPVLFTSAAMIVIMIIYCVDIVLSVEAVEKTAEAAAEEIRRIFIGAF